MKSLGFFNFMSLWIQKDQITLLDYQVKIRDLDKSKEKKSYTVGVWDIAGFETSFSLRLPSRQGQKIDVLNLPFY